MKVVVTDSVEIVLRNSREDTRRRAWAWIENLERWDTDPYMQQHSRKLSDPPNTYMLVTNTDIRIFFTVEKDVITVLEVAREAAIAGSSQAAGPGQS